MSDLGSRLERLGLSQYLEVFVSEGFDTWETVLDITESDLYVWLDNHRPRTDRLIGVLSMSNSVIDGYARVFCVSRRCIFYCNCV